MFIYFLKKFWSTCNICRANHWNQMLKNKNQRKMKFLSFFFPISLLIDDLFISLFEYEYKKMFRK